jgi:hypothetical protein
VARRDCRGNNYCSHVEHRCWILIHWTTVALVAKRRGRPPVPDSQRMKKAADAEKFRKFADAHRNGVYDKMLAQVRGQCGDPNWAPTSMLSAMWFGAQVNKELSTLYRRICS